MSELYQPEVLGEYDDDGTMPENVEELRQAVVGRRIVSAERRDVRTGYWGSTGSALVLTLDNGQRVVLRNSEACCAYTELEDFWLDPSSVEHVITGVGTTEGYTIWHIYADLEDVMRLNVGWSSGNPFYYGYGFYIDVEEIEE